ncbi:hypothetical protein HYW87_04005 [Candidatus Roizmanbacteria bacterium]|nr:hypothetical protein [Candidatus Roizmanbacteria bacterium]
MRIKINIKSIIIAVLVLLGLGYFYVAKVRPINFSPSVKNSEFTPVKGVLAAKFDYLSQNGNSSCSSSFQQSIAKMPDEARLQGSCCSPMSYHRYSEQVEGLKKYKDIPEIPKDPYDIEAKLAKNLMSHYEDEFTQNQQKAYDYAMEHSSEKGPCCCKCWRWFVYGGLGKILIQTYGFTGEQVTDVWNLSDGCGGDNEHHH